jgi:glucose-1-phosphate cytidylyltransferase
MVEGNTDLKVLILCGGKGERLKPLTESVPKPLIKIKGRPILSYLLSHFESYGFRKFVIAVGYRSEAIIRYFEQNHRNIEIEISDSGDADIVNRIKDAAGYLTGDFIVCYGDTLADVDLYSLIRFHKGHGGDVSVTCYPLQSQFGILEISNGGRVSSFVEKPVLDKWINIGYFYFSRKILNELEKKNSFLEFLRESVNNGNLYSYKHRGMHITVNTVKELQEAEDNISQLEERIGSMKNA